MSSDHTTHLQGLLERIRQGDEAAERELVSCSYERLRRLAKAIFHKSFPRLENLQETGDILHAALLRLIAALRRAPVATVRDYFRLSAELIRRTLIDIARHHDRRAATDDAGAEPSHDVDNAPADSSSDPAKLAEWTEFHRKVEELSETEREIVQLLFYQGLSQREAAEVMGLRGYPGSQSIHKIQKRQGVTKQEQLNGETHAQSLSE